MASERWFDDAHHRVMRGLVAVLLLGVCGLVKAEQIANFEDLALEKGILLERLGQFGRIRQRKRVV